MSEKWYGRTQLLLGAPSVEKLAASKVAVFGVGGVGGYVVEALARSGIGAFLLVDNDRVSLSNLNRQIVATRDTLGLYKVDAAKDRILSINPDAEVEVKKCFFLPENASDIDFAGFDYVVDAVDTVTAKLQIVMSAKEAGVPVISSMGAGNKLDPTKFEVTDVFKTEMDPLAKVMRRELKKRGIHSLKVVYSKEKPVSPVPVLEESAEQNDSLNASSAEISGEKTIRGARRQTPGSTAFVPAAAGLIIAAEVVKDLTRNGGVRT